MKLTHNQIETVLEMERCGEFENNPDWKGLQFENPFKEKPNDTGQRHTASDQSNQRTDS